MAKADPHVEIFVLCDTALISRENKLSIIGIFDQIVLDKIPFNYPKITLVAVVSGQPQTEHSLQLEIKNPADQVISSVNLKVVLGVGGRSNIITELTNFPISSTGIYKTILSENKKLLATSELSVGKTSHQPQLSN
jgi:hypothetical protein